MQRWLTILRLRATAVFRRRRAEQELDEELQAHIEREVEANVAAGLSPRDARAAARRAMGPVASNMEACRDARGVNVLDYASRDLRFAVRQLAHSPGFAAAAVFVLALGMAASMSIFGFVDAALVKPLPYRDQGRLLDVFLGAPAQGRGLVSYLDYLDWARLNHVFGSIAAHDVRGGFTLSGADGPERVTGLRVSPGFFRTLGVATALGRDFLDDADEAAVVISYGAWQSRFGGAPEAIGRTIALDAVPHEIVGVLPRSFHFAPAGPGEFWTTIRGGNACWKVRGCQSMRVIARLRDGVSQQTAMADMQTVAAQLHREHRDTNRSTTVGAVPLRDTLIGDVRPILLILAGGAGLLLLIAAVNVASLLLARSARRTREIAVRRALGASSGRLLIQFATESIVLVFVSAALGVAGAGWGMRFLLSLMPPDMLAGLPYLDGLGVNGRLVAFAAAIACAQAMLFTLAAAVRIGRREDGAGLQDSPRGSTGSSWRRVGSPLVVVELALAVVLLVSAGLIGKSVFRMLEVDVGFDPEGVFVQGVGMPAGTLGPVNRDEVAALADRVAERVHTLPGVASVGFADLLPLTASGPWPPVSSSFQVAGRPALASGYIATVRSVGGNYFGALHARLVRGRAFTAADNAAAPPVAIVNQTMAHQLFAGEDPIGTRIVRAGSQPAEIVGVVADLQEGSLETPARPAVYTPFIQRPNSHFGLVVRASSSELDLQSSVAAAIREVRRDLVVLSGTTMQARLARLPAASIKRALAWLVGAFAAVALTLSIVGLYGVVSYSVGQRTREIGVRMALGAQRRSVYRLVMTEAAMLVCVGAAAGTAGAIGAAMLMRRELFGVAAWDAPTLAGATTTLAISALVASFFPARRAASVDPIEVLRNE